MVKIWRVIDLLKTTEQYFSEKSIENPRLNAELLLGNALKMNRVELYMAYERPLSDNELNDFREKVRRRGLFEPLQYITGNTEFMGFPFKVNRHVLIPRPETEILVETILEMKNEIGKDAVFLDVGTGSGCIPISLAKLWPEGKYFALDISSEALKVALDNTRLNNLEAFLYFSGEDAAQQNGQLLFMKHDIFEEQMPHIMQNITVLISNPPYIAIDEMSTLPAEVRDYEPEVSLTDNSNGLSFYRRLFEMAAGEYFPELKYLFLEMSGSQPNRIVQLAAEYKFNNIGIRKDLTGIERVLIIRI